MDTIPLNDYKPTYVKARNRLASMNGTTCEEIADREIFNQEKSHFVEGLNDRIDRVMYGLPVEIKSCQYWIRNDTRGKTRHGMFCLDPKQHDQLIKTRGYYLFIVRILEIVYRIVLVEAEKVVYRKQVTWTTIDKLLPRVRR